MANFNEFTLDGQDDVYGFDSSYAEGDEKYSYEDDYLDRDDDDLNEDDQDDTFEDITDDNDGKDDDYTGRSTNNQNDPPIYTKDMPYIDGAKPGTI